MNQVQLLKETCQEHNLIEIVIQETDSAFVNTLKGKLKLPFKEKMKHEEDYLMLKPTFRVGNWNRENHERLIKNLNLKGGNYSRRVNVLIKLKERERERINLCGELERRNRLHHERQVQTNQEIDELRTIFCEEANQVRRLQFDELSQQQERDPNTVNRLLEQIQELQDHVNLSSEDREFHDLCTDVPTQPAVILSPKEMLGRDPVLPAITRNTMGDWEGVYIQLDRKTCFTLLLKPGQRWRPLPNYQRKETS